MLPLRTTRNPFAVAVGADSISARAILCRRQTPRTNNARPCISSHIQQHTLHDFSLDNPPNPVYNKYNSKMYKGVTVL